MSIQTAMKQVESSLTEAQEGLESAEEAVVHFTVQVAKLNEAREALCKIFSADDLAPPLPKGSKAPAKKAGARGTSNVPKTDAAFWMGLLTTTPQDTKEILDAACAKLSVTDAENVKVIRARQTSFLQTAAKDGTIKSEGERLNRKYFV